jgi:hypothetical protein
LRICSGKCDVRDSQATKMLQTTYHRFLTSYVTEPSLTSLLGMLSSGVKTGG